MGLWRQAGPCLFGCPVGPQCAQELVGFERGIAQHLGEAAGADAALYLHLPQTVLGVDVTQGIVGIEIVLGIDVWNAMCITNDVDRCLESGQLDGAVGDRQ